MKDLDGFDRLLNYGENLMIKDLRRRLYGNTDEKSLPEKGEELCVFCHKDKQLVQYMDYYVCVSCLDEMEIK